MNNISPPAARALLLQQGIKLFAAITEIGVAAITLAQRTL